MASNGAENVTTTTTLSEETKQDIDERVDNNNNNENNNEEEAEEAKSDNINDKSDNKKDNDIEDDEEILDVEDELLLQYRWALWYSPPKSTDADPKKWDAQRVKKIVEFGTVKEFWRIFNNLTPPSSLKDGSDLQLFRAGVQPEWEDPFNQNGGTWRYRINKDDTNQKLDTTWFNTVLTMIGDQFDDADDICGIVVSIRANTNRVGLWTKHADDREATKRIGRQFKDINRIKSKIYFESHDDAMSKSRPNKSSEMSF